MKKIDFALGAVVKQMVATGFRVFLAKGFCEQHGEYESITREGEAAICPDCILESQKLADEEEIRNRFANNGLITFWNTGRMQNELPPRFSDATFESYIVRDEAQKMTRDRVMQFGEAFQKNTKEKRNMIFTGRVGTGKTHLAISLGRLLAERGFRAAYLTIFDLMRPAQERAFEGSQSIIAQLSSYDLVVLDEVGAHPDFGFSSELVASTIFQLIDSRYLNCLATLLVTNIEVEDLESSRAGLGYRVMDRLADAEVLKFYWESSR